jgi:xanthine dehydrogenase accessory factor
MRSLDIEVLHQLHNWLLAGHRAALVTVARTFGASPRPPGSMLAVRDDGVLVGSVSGGCIEDDLILRRETFLSSTAKPVRARYGVTGEEAQRFGLPCGGELEVVIEPQPKPADVAALLTQIRDGRVFFRVVDLATGAWSERAATALDATNINDAEFCCHHGPRWRMLIIGASEISIYLAEIAKTLDFRVFVCDPRDEYRHSWRVAETAFVDGMPDDAVVAFQPDLHTVIVAVSHDPKLDDMALMAALKTPAFYVGAVGSKRTTEARRARLLSLDVSAVEVARLHGPVGLAIGSRTPPEIAVAIAAELVAARNQIALVGIAAAGATTASQAA